MSSVLTSGYIFVPPSPSLLLLPPPSLLLLPPSSSLPSSSMFSLSSPLSSPSPPRHALTPVLVPPAFQRSNLSLPLNTSPESFPMWTLRCVCVCTCVRCVCVCVRAFDEGGVGRAFVPPLLHDVAPPLKLIHVCWSTLRLLPSYIRFQYSILASPPPLFSQP